MPRQTFRHPALPFSAISATAVSTSAQGPHVAETFPASGENDYVLINGESVALCSLEGGDVFVDASAVQQGG